MAGLAVVTGGTAGIGLGIAQHLAVHGYRVAVLGRDEQRLNRAISSLADIGENDHLAIVGDVRCGDSIRQAFEDPQMQQASVLINAAGVNHDALLVRAKKNDMNAMLSTNLVGTIQCCREIARIFLRNRTAGRIINISSAVALRGAAGQSVYAASKGGVHAFTRNLALELASRQILVNSIAPGYVETAMTEHLDRAEICQRIPLKRFARVEDLLPAISMLLESKYITGAVLPVDGGLSC